MLELAIVLVFILVWAYLFIWSRGPATDPNAATVRRPTSSGPPNSPNSSSLVRTSRREKFSDFARFDDKFASLESIQEALTEAGLESCNLIIGIDYTGSNRSQGRRTFRGRSLHTVDPTEMNPYQNVISIIGKTLSAFDEDQLIPVFGFGDVTTKGRSVFPFYPEKRPCAGLADVLDRYATITPTVQLSGPTNFAPIIREALEILQESGQMEYHILLIIADGQVTSEGETISAIEEASNYPLSIVVVGVGDGPWDMMIEFDDRLPYRKFDNFQFVDFHACSQMRNPDVAFAVRALMEIPDQFKAVKQLGLLGRSAHP